MELDQRSNEHIRRELGERVRTLRKSRGLTQAALATRAGLSRPTVSTFERGNDVSLDSFLSILRVLDLLEGLSAALPEPGVSPIAAFAGSTPKRRSAGTTEKPAWTWGDERNDQS